MNMAFLCSMATWVIAIFFASPVIADSTSQCRSPFTSYNLISENPEENDSLEDGFALMPGRNSIIFGHIGREMNWCESGSKYYCFTSRDISFAVPKSPLTIGERWSWGARRYEVKAIESWTLIGTTASTWLIFGKPEHGAVDTYYYYSLDNGLLLIKQLRGEPEQLIFVSAAVRGFPYLYCIDDELNMYPFQGDVPIKSRRQK